MRKRLKIKALTLIFSWTVIFLHGVIPHIHDHGNLPAKSDHNLTHSCSGQHINAESGENLPLFIAGSDRNHSNEACHFNPNLFPNINIDNNFIYVEIIEVSIEQEEVAISSPDVRPQLKKPHLLSTRGLRAPPVA